MGFNHLFTVCLLPSSKVLVTLEPLTVAEITPFCFGEGGAFPPFRCGLGTTNLDLFFLASFCCLYRSSGSSNSNNSVENKNTAIPVFPFILTDTPQYLYSSLKNAFRQTFDAFASFTITDNSISRGLFLLGIWNQQTIASDTVPLFQSVYFSILSYKLLPSFPTWLTLFLFIKSSLWSRAAFQRTTLQLQVGCLLSVLTYRMAYWQWVALTLLLLILSQRMGIKIEGYVLIWLMYRMRSQVVMMIWGAGGAGLGLSLGISFGLGRGGFLGGWQDKRVMITAKMTIRSKPANME